MRYITTSSQPNLLMLKISNPTQPVRMDYSCFVWPNKEKLSFYLTISNHYSINYYNYTIRPSISTLSKLNLKILK